MKEIRSVYTKTKKGLIYIIYRNQRINSTRRGYTAPSYTLYELREWAFKQQIFHTLFDQWVASGYSKTKVPSFDRKDDYAPYTLSNIQIMTWEENELKGNNDVINGKNNKLSKAILQYTADGEFIEEYYSIAQASRITNIARSNLSCTCSGIQNTAGGFKWKYKEGIQK